MQRFHTSSSAGTIRLGRALGEALLRRGPMASARRGRAISHRDTKPHATVVALAGELGAGKTTFVKGVYKGLGSRAPVTSPTFIIVRRARLRAGRFKNIFHVDAYRLDDGHALRELGLHGIMRDPHNIVVIEWSERVSKSIPRSAIHIAFAHGRTAHERSVTMNGIVLPPRT